MRHPGANDLPWPTRQDFFENAFLGYGTGRDKLSFGSFHLGCRLTDYELHAMYYTDDVSARIVNARPKEMLRRGYTLRSKKNPDGAAELQKAGTTLGLDVSVLRGMQWGRLFGGAVIVIGANDSADLTKPLNPAAVRDVKFLNVVDRRWVGVQRYQLNPSLPSYGEPEIYYVGGLVEAIYPVHATRVIRFDGVPETDQMTRKQLVGWTYSVLQRPYEVVRAFATAFKSVEQLMADASQGVWKISNLLEMISADRNALITRLQFSDMTRSAGRAIMLDAEAEDYKREPTPMNGYDAILDRFMMRLAAAAEMPVTRLMGRSPAGMNATGESDDRAWYDVLATDQQNELSPVLLRLYNVLGRGKFDDLEIEYKPLWQPTETEKSTIDKTRAETNQIYITTGVVLPEQVAIAEFGSGEGRIEIDEDSLRQSIENETELMLNPPPTPAVANTIDPNDPNAEEDLVSGKPVGQ